MIDDETKADVALAVVDEPHEGDTKTQSNTSRTRTVMLLFISVDKV